MSGCLGLGVGMEDGLGRGSLWVQGSDLGHENVLKLGYGDGQTTLYE